MGQLLNFSEENVEHTGMMGRKVFLHGLTLRDGEQAPGMVFGVEQKLEITKSLSAAGIQYIEAGFPATSKMEQRGLKNNANAGLSLKITCLCSGMGKDIDIAKLCDADGVIIELTVSYPRIKYQLDWEVQRQ